MTSCPRSTNPLNRIGTPASFDGWYEQHLGEILSIPGFTSAQRYKLEEVTKPAGGTIPGRRLCIYTTSKSPAELRAEMERMNLLSADSYEKLKDIDSSGPALPRWWDSVRFAAWNLIPIGERIEAPAIPDILLP